MPENYSQPWWRSKTIWASAVAVIGAIGNMVTSGHIDTTSLMAALGGIVAIYGRVAADKPIAGTTAAKRVSDKITDALMTTPPRIDPRTKQEHL